MMKNLNHTGKLISCTEINRCLDEVDELDLQREKTCTDAIACYNFLVWKNDECCQKKGCFHSTNDVLFNCNKNIIKIDDRTSMRKKNGYQGYCCNDADYCNGIQQIEEQSLSIILIGSSLAMCFLLTLACLLILIRRKKNNRRRRKRNMDKDRIENHIQSNSNLNPYITSGSGAGMPLLMPRTLAKEIQLECQLGKGGKFGEVWRGSYQNRKVAVKLFQNTDSESWKKEKEIYEHYSLASEFILKYLGSDITSRHESIQFWIVLDYHELGSLYDYLQTNSLGREQALSIMYSAISGLVHLHDIYEFTTSKPSICHRDLKSKNLLMKSDSVVCIADFGLSVTSKGIELNKYENFNIRSGTTRYMPPEVLDESIDVKSFKAFQMADIYSFSLLLWEIVVHSELNPQLTKGYKLPYYEYVCDTSSFEEMRKIVSIEQKRPSLQPFLSEISQNERKNEDENQIAEPMIVQICNLIRNCWQGDASKRFDHMMIRNKFTQIIKRN